MKCTECGTTEGKMFMIRPEHGEDTKCEKCKDAF